MLGFLAMNIVRPTVLFYFCLRIPTTVYWSQFILFMLQNDYDLEFSHILLKHIKFCL